MTHALELRGLSKRYDGFSLTDVNLTLPSGCIMGLIGENGAGKTTLMRLALGLETRDSGEVEVLGSRALTPDIKEHLGVVLDESGFPEGLTLRDVGAVLKRCYRTWDAKAFERYARRFSLPQGQAIKTFSRGTKMKLAIAVALSHAPRLLVLDEATSGLDPIVRDEVLEIFNEFTREEDHSILISSHILSDLEKLCDYIAFLHQGRLLFCEEKDLLLEQYGILTDSAEQADALQPEAIVAREPNGYGGVRCLVRRDLAPAGFQLERPSIEDIILFLVKGAKHS